ncbi:amidase family protein, partial [Nocardia sp. NPDC004722]
MTVWIHRRTEADVEAEMAAAAGPLAGLRLAVKDNVDVAGLPTTAACPEYAYLPERHAPAVAALRAAGAVVVGKTNLDQFATGLVGTRSPYGVVENALRPGYVSGGSSSGSAAAVAAGEADIAIGTDTAGSGRIPAAFHGLVGIKPKVGVISTE